MGNLTVLQADGTLVVSAIGGFFAALLLYTIIERVVDSYSTRGQQAILSVIAIPTGLWVAIGISPIQHLATAITQEFAVIPEAFHDFIWVTLTLETIFLFLLGFYRMWNSGGVIGGISYLITFGAACAILYSPIFGIVGIVLGPYLLAFAPARGQFGGRR